MRRDDPRSPSSRRFERATRFSKTTRGHLVGSVVSATRRTCSSDTVCCICASFSRLLWNIVGRSERAPRGEHSGAPASARQRAIRRQEKKPRQLARGSVSPPAQLTRRLGKKRRTRAEPSASSSQAVAKKEFSKLYHCGSMFSRPSRFAAARITASESDFTLARSRPRGWRVRARRSGGRHFGARKRRRPSALERDVSGARAHADHGDCGHDAGSRVGDARVRARTPRLQNAHRGRLRVEDARLARAHDARRSARAPALEPRRTSSARALREVWSGTTRRTERRTTTTPPNARRPDTLRTTTLRMANEERTRKRVFCWKRRNPRRVTTTTTKRETRLNVLERLPTRTGWTMIGSGVRRVSSGSTPSRPSARRRTRSTRRTRRIF